MRWLGGRALRSIRLVRSMIERYTRPEMGRIWNDENKYACWLQVELAASEALASLGEVPEDAAVDVERLFAIEREVKDDVIAFTTAVAEKMAAAGKQMPVFLY